MNTSILGVGTAVPEHKMSQAEALEMCSGIVCENDKQRRLARVLFKKSGVQNRHTAVPYQAAYNWCQPSEDADVSSLSHFTNVAVVQPTISAGVSAGPTTGERMQMYAEFAGHLAELSAREAVAKSGIEPEQLTHLVTVSCTGFESPGVDIELINHLHLPTTIQRVNVGFMGCHGAINGLRTALAITQADATARVLLTATELCSLHYRFQWDNEGIIGNALFADGSASIVLGQQVSDRNEPSWDLMATGSVVIPDSMDSMSWKVGDHGFEMLLTSDVGDKIEAALNQWLVEWLDTHGYAMDQIDFWGVHPGGPRILDAVQASLGLTDESLKTSRSVLSSHGNMSSPTVLFILNEFVQQHRLQQNKVPSAAVLLAFGPGLVAEIALIKVNP